MAQQVKAFIIAEINYGQIYYEVERCAAGNAKSYLSNRVGGQLLNPFEILEKMEEVNK